MPESIMPVEAAASVCPPVLPVADLLTGDDLPVNWVVPDLFAQGSLIALAGEAGAGKSFFSYALSLALATGEPVLGRTIDRPYRVLYFEQENSLHDVTGYLRMAWIGLGRPAPALIADHLKIAHFRLGDPLWGQTAETYCRAYHPEMIIIDTTTPACAVQDENDNAEATRAIQIVRRLMALSTPTATCLALKHAKPKAAKGGGYTMRGAKAWEGAVDGVIFLLRTPGRPRGDGLATTVLQPAKTRAFGLRDPITIRPSWVEGKRGISLFG